MHVPRVSVKAELTNAGHVYPSSQHLLDTFTLKSRFGEEVQLYKELTEGRIKVPIQCGLRASIDRSVDGQDIQFSSNFIPRNQDQTRMVEKSAGLLLNGESHILQAATGFGKTIVATEIAARVGKKFMVIVPKEDIVGQWMRAFEIVLGLSSQDVGLIQGDSCNVAGKKAVIAMIHSICKDGRYPDWVYREFGLVIVDECHVVSAATFSNAMWLLPGKLRLGLSATPYRQDGKDFVFYAHIGTVKAKSESMVLTPKILVKKCTYLIPTKRVPVTVNGEIEWHDAKDYTTPGRTSGLNSALAKSYPRNIMIAEFVYAAYLKGRNIIIFSELRESHLEGIEAELIIKGVKERDIAWYVGGLTEKERESAKGKRVLLSTYKMASMATDIPWLDTCVLATPRTDVVQIVGRILREYPDKPQPVVFDIIDTDCKLFTQYFKKRLNWYAKIGAEIVECK